MLNKRFLFTTDFYFSKYKFYDRNTIYEKTVDSMSNDLNKIQDSLSNEDQQKLVSLLLIYRGTEFSRPIRIEIKQKTVKLRGKIFHCDP